MLCLPPLVVDCSNYFPQVKMRDISQLALLSGMMPQIPTVVTAHESGLETTVLSLVTLLAFH